MVDARQFLVWYNLTSWGLWRCWVVVPYQLLVWYNLKRCLKIVPIVVVP